MGWSVSEGPEPIDPAMTVAGSQNPPEPGESSSQTAIGLGEWNLDSDHGAHRVEGFPSPRAAPKPDRCQSPRVEPGIVHQDHEEPRKDNPKTGFLQKTWDGTLIYL